MKAFLGGDYSLVFFKLPNQLEGIVNKKETLLFEQFRRRRTWWYMAYLPPVGEGKENWGRDVPPGRSNPDPLLIFLP